jgi:hypothetical protein
LFLPLAYDSVQFKIKVIVMSHFYRELHDRELLNQAEAVLQEVQRRALVDVILPRADAQQHETAQGIVFPRRLAGVAVENGKLALWVEQSFFRE